MLKFQIFSLMFIGYVSFLLPSCNFQLELDFELDQYGSEPFSCSPHISRIELIKVRYS